MATEQELIQSALDKSKQTSQFLDTNINTGIQKPTLQATDYLNNSYLTDANGKQYVFVPKTAVDKGVVYNAWWKPTPVDRQAYNDAFLKPETFSNASMYKYGDTNGYIWELGDAVNKGVVAGVNKPSWWSYDVTANAPAISGIGYPTYAPSQYTNQVSYIMQPNKIDSSHAQQYFISPSSPSTVLSGTFGYEYVNNSWLAQRIRSVLPAINLLAPVLLDVFVAPGTGAMFSMGKAFGNSLATGNWENGLIDVAKLYAIQQGASSVGNAFGKEFAGYGDVAKSIVTAGSSNAVAASLMGRDPIQGFITGGISGAVGAAAKSIDGFADLPVPVQKMFAAGVGNALQGKTSDQINQSVMTAAIRSGLEAMGNAVDANKYFTDTMGREPTAEELNKFAWYTDRNALQSSLKTYASAVDAANRAGVTLNNDQIDKTLTSSDPTAAVTGYIKENNETNAVNEGWANYDQKQEAAQLGITTPGDYQTYQAAQAYPQTAVSPTEAPTEAPTETPAEEPKVPSQTIQGDDGSTLTINPDGTVSSSEAGPDVPLGMCNAVGQALGLQGTDAILAGNDLMRTALSGGDMNVALNNVLSQYSSPNISNISKILADNPDFAPQLAQAITVPAVQGQDVSLALNSTLSDISVDAAVKNISGFSTLPAATQDGIRAAVQNELKNIDFNVDGALQDAAAKGAATFATGSIPDFKNLDPAKQDEIFNKIQEQLKNTDLTPDAIQQAVNDCSTAVNQIIPSETPPPSITDKIPSETPAETPSETPAETPAETPSETPPSTIEEATQPSPAEDYLKSQTPNPTMEAGLIENYDDFYRMIGIDPESLSDTPPMSQEEMDALFAQWAETQPSAPLKAPSVASLVSGTPTKTTQTPGTPATAPATTVTTTPATTTAPKTAQDMTSLLALLASAEEGQQEGQQGAPAGAQVQVGGGYEDLNYLDGLGELPDYLGALNRQGTGGEGEQMGGSGMGGDTGGYDWLSQTPYGYDMYGEDNAGAQTMGGEGEPGQDTGAATEGGTTGGPLTGGGGGRGYKILPGGVPMSEDQSSAETQRLLNARNQVGIGALPTSRNVSIPTSRNVSIPTSRNVSIPVPTITPPTITPLSLGSGIQSLSNTSDVSSQIEQMQDHAKQMQDHAKQMQDYAKQQMQDYAKQMQDYASQAANQAKSYTTNLFGPKTWRPVPGTPFYTDGQGNYGQKVVYRDSSGRLVARIQ